MRDCRLWIEDLRFGIAIDALFDQLASIILANLHRPSPHHFERLGMGPARQLTPAFYGCYDWHSCVHMHWAAVRLMRRHPDLPLADDLRVAVSRSLTEENIQGEVQFTYSSGPFEVPYGLAWLLQLCAELREWDDVDAQVWLKRLEPLESLTARALAQYTLNLAAPVRTGLHQQTAFALGLLLDWAQHDSCIQAYGWPSVRSQLDEIRSRCLRWFGDIRASLIEVEPSPHDFLSPALAEADLIRRVIGAGSTTPPTGTFTRWIEKFLPDGIPLRPVTAPDDADGQASHLHGLNLSRAWMLEGIASALQEGHPLRQQALALAESHKQMGVAATLRTRDRFVCSHWLPSFVIYCLTKRGLPGG